MKRLKSLKTMDLILIVIFITFVVFTHRILTIYEKVGSEPSTLVGCVFVFLGGECGIMGWIKTTKERNKQREWEKEDKLNREEES